MEPGQRPSHEVRYEITDEEAREFLRRLTDPEDGLYEDLQLNPRDVLSQFHIEITGIPDEVQLPEREVIAGFLETYESGESKTNNVGYAILYFMLGAMPLVVAEPHGPA
jgi:hypothetical protein